MARVNPLVRQNRGAILDDANASVRSEAEDERPSPAASNPTLSATFFRSVFGIFCLEVRLSIGSVD
jgi:hypothetical protein